MKIIVIGLEAAGAAAATKVRRNSEKAQITVYDQSAIVSHITCGIPYYLGEEVTELGHLVPRTPQWFKERWNIDVFPRHHVTKIDPKEKQLEIYDEEAGETITDTYDKLVIATGASPFVPPPFNLDSYENVFPVRNMEDAASIHQYIEDEHVHQTTIIGSGSIGLEIAEQLTKRGIEVTIVELAPQLIPKMDTDIAHMIAEKMKEKGVRVLVGDTVERVEGEQKITGFVTGKGQTGETDMVIIATGVRPNTQLAEKAGIAIGSSHAIAVNEKMETSIQDIYAVGDVAESFSLITGKPIYRPLAATATKMGRIAGDAATGGNLKHQGILGTGIFRVFEMTVGITGFTEREAEEEGFDALVVYTIRPDKEGFVGGKDMVIKAVADKETGRFLGAQIIGEEGVDKRLDVLATALYFKAHIQDLQHLDLSYSMPFSTPWDPVHYSGMMLLNAWEKKQSITPQELIERQAQKQPMQIIDVRPKAAYEKSHVETAINIPMEELREQADGLDKDMFTVVYCNRGGRSNAAQHLLANKDFQDVRLLSGGNIRYQEMVVSEQAKKQASGK